jgi:hypothetical protein
VHLVGILDENILKVLIAMVSGVREENIFRTPRCGWKNKVKRTLKREDFRLWFEFNWLGKNQ